MTSHIYLRHCTLLLTASILGIASSTALAAEGERDTDTIIVTGIAAPTQLDDSQKAGSRMGLTERETPATVLAVTRDQIELKGLRTGLEAYNATPGLTAGNGGGDPVLLSMRGFTGGAVTLLYDDIRMLTSTMTARNIDTFNVERIEVLKGPASVLYGEGSLAGVVNIVSKKARLDRNAADIMLSGGSFGTIRAGAGFNVVLNDKMALRVDGVAGKTDGWVNDTGTRTRQLTANLLYRPSERFDLSLTYDHYEDNNASYFGTPLLPRSVARDPVNVVSDASGLVLDRSIRSINYGPADQFMKARSDWINLSLKGDLGGGWTLRGDGVYYHARRFWGYYNAPAYNAGTGLISRGVNRLNQTHDFFLGRAIAANDSEIGEHRNRFSIGVEFNRNDLVRPRSVGTIAAVDPFNPVRGVLPPDTAAGFPAATARNVDVSRIDDVAVYAEDAFNVTDALILVGGARYESIKLNREFIPLNTGANTFFGNRYRPFSWRVGAVYSIAPKVQLYGQYSSAVAPVATPIIATAANTAYRLTKGYTYEAGVKASFWGDRGAVTLSAYKIRQNDIVTIDPNNVNNSVQGGSQSSRGIEATLSLTPLTGLRIEGSTAYVDAQFDQLDEIVSGQRISRAGNRPVNVPDQVYQASAFYDIPATPLTLGAAARATGAMYANNSNATRVRGYQVMDLSLAYRLPFATLTGRVRNVFDSFYVDWTGGNGTQLYIGAPRGWELSLTSHF